MRLLSTPRKGLYRGLRGFQHRAEGLHITGLGGSEAAHGEATAEAHEGPTSAKETEDERNEDEDEQERGDGRGEVALSLHKRGPVQDQANRLQPT